MNEWILCSEKSPSETGLYIVTMERTNGYVYVTRAVFDDVKGGCLFNPLDGDVIAWMFEPEPYRRLKPCPFCLNSDLKVNRVHNVFSEEGNNVKWYVKCNTCGCRLDQQSTKAQAIIMWNKRPYEGKKPIEETQETDS